MERKTKKSRRFADQGTVERVRAWERKWIKLRRDKWSTTRDFVYVKGRIRGEYITEDDLAEMLHHLLDLGSKPRTWKSVKGHQIVRAIFSIIIRELRAHRTFTIMHVGRLYIKRINRLRNRVEFEPSDAMVEALSLDDRA